MNAVHGTESRVGNMLSAIRTWPDKLAGLQSKTQSSHHSTHLGLRIQKKIAQFDRTIAMFRQRRWS
ncbi:MAG: hypothetical protein PHT99_07420 [Methanoregula sp.]|nr:hypothetical protein [Methanoregula sp.]